jgi:DNA helicase-2/ATP-dependent DNA helicase PcrA
MSVSSQADMEEERRLFYVAVTRGETLVHLSYSELRYKWGQQSFAEPSRFIHELDPNFIEDFTAEQILSLSPNHQSKSSFDVPKAQPKTDYKAQKPKFAKKPAEKLQAQKAKLPDGNFKKVSNTRVSSAADSDNSKVVVGSNVYHNRFGRGKVINIESAGNDRKATVFFNTAGEKKLLLKFAKLQILKIIILKEIH